MPAHLRLSCLVILAALPALTQAAAPPPTRPQPLKVPVAMWDPVTLRLEVGAVGGGPTRGESVAQRIECLEEEVAVLHRQLHALRDGATAWWLDVAPLAGKSGHVEGTPGPGLTAPPSVPFSFFNERSFEIPFQVSPGRTFTRAVLYAASGGGSYKEVAAVTPPADKFLYRAPADGWYHCG